MTPTSPLPAPVDRSARDHERLLIVDFGSQVTQLIARFCRESGIYCEIHPFNRVDAAFLESFAPMAMILSGGPASVHEAGSPQAHPAWFGAGIPVLGICYGQQAMCVTLGGRAAASDHREYGRAEIEILTDTPLFAGLATHGARERVWMSHGDRVETLPPGFLPLARTPSAPFAAIGDPARRLFGVQFHPEVVHTPCGRQILRNFTHGIAGFSGSWSMAAFRADAIARLRARIGPTARVLCGLSGGVDSAVAAMLLHEAIGERLACVFVDTGLMRHNEAAEVVTLFRDTFRVHLVHVEAEAEFLARLDGVADPEAKRKIIGACFVELFEREAEKLGGAEFLAQGTLYPDVIESVSLSGGPSVTIKSHHNVGGLPARMNMKLVEPLRELFKDEVRVLGRELGLPEAFVGRHPFPGPGLAIRMPGAIDRAGLNILRAADAIYLDEIRKAGLYDTIWQAFAVLLPVRSVGVMGDARSFERVLALRAVTSVDGMTADFFPFDLDLLGKIATRIINEVKGINRVVYDITGKPPGTIEWE